MAAHLFVAACCAMNGAWVDVEVHRSLEPIDAAAAGSHADHVGRLISGCTAYVPRASYTLFNGDESAACDASTPCRLCGGDCTPFALPSGMQFPRHNVPQYLGNAVWDGMARDGFPRMVAAVMGDPFAFMIAPELDALRRLLTNTRLSPGALAHQLAAAWSVDPRYEGAHNSNGTRVNFLNAISGRVGTSGGLTPAFITSSSVWQSLGPAPVKQRIEQALEGEVEFSPEAAMCAAVYLMDAMFAERGHDTIMNDLPSDRSEMGNVSVATLTIFEELYNATPSVLPSNVRDDPHNVIYTSPYQYNANGWYGGNISVKFLPTISGSGIDTKWAVYRGCPMPGHEENFCAERRERLNQTTPACDMPIRQPHGIECVMEPTPALSRQTPDQGEMRTPHYKEPREILGFNWFDWQTHTHCIFVEAGRHGCPQFVHNSSSGIDYDASRPDGPDGQGSARFDYTALQRHVQWSVQRYQGANASEYPPLGLILGAFAQGDHGAFGIDYDERLDKYTHTTPPPQAWGRDTLVPSENYILPDLPARTTRLVPVWGVLYPCETTNLPDLYLNYTVPPAPIAVDPLRCAAQRILRRHRADTLWNPLYETMYRARLPRQWELELANLRVWSAGATLDFAAGQTHPSGGEQQAVCVLTFAASVRLDARC